MGADACFSNHDSACCSKPPLSEKLLVPTVHVFFLLASVREAFVCEAFVAGH